MLVAYRSVDDARVLQVMGAHLLSGTEKPQ
jgi:hypothetical protein